MKLFKPQGYKALTAAEKSKICNGCGSKGLGGWLVPDTIYGLNISEACNIHDWQYSQGATLQDKEYADRIFLNNLVRIIDSGSKCLRWLRRRRALKMHWAVKTFGEPAFWDKQ